MTLIRQAGEAVDAAQFHPEEPARSGSDFHSAGGQPCPSSPPRCKAGAAGGSAIHLAPMTDADDLHDQPGILDGVDQAVVAGRTRQVCRAPASLRAPGGYRIAQSPSASNTSAAMTSRGACAAPARPRFQTSS